MLTRTRTFRSRCSAVAAVCLALAAVGPAAAAGSDRLAYRSPGYGGWHPSIVERNARFVPASTAAPARTALGAGDHPDMLVDAAGTAHIVWRVPQANGADEIRYCRLPRAATRCSVSYDLPTPQPDSPATTNSDPDGPRILVVGDQLVVVDRRFPNPVSTPDCQDGQPCTSDSNVYLWTSDDGGQTFTGPGLFGNNAMNGGAVVFGTDSPFIGTLGGNSTAPSSSAPPDGSYQAAHAGAYTYHYAQLVPNGTPVDLTVDPNGSRPIAALLDGNGNLVVREWNGQGDPNDAGQWSQASTPASDGAVAAGPHGAFALVDPAPGPVQLRPISNLSAPGPSVFAANSTNDLRLLADAAGGFRAIATSINNSPTSSDDQPRQLLSSTSTDGSSWSAPAVLASLGPSGTDGFYNPTAAMTADGGGFAAWNTGQSNEIGIVGFGSQAPTGKPGLGNLPGGGIVQPPGGGSNSCTDVHFGDIDALAENGCFLHQVGDRSGAEFTSGEFRLNGLEIIPDANVKVRIDAARHTIDSVGGAVRVILRIPGVNDITLWHGELAVQLPNAGDGQSLFNFDTSKFPSLLEGFPIDGKVDVVLAHDSVKIPISLGLPSYLGGVTGAATLEANNTDGLVLDSLEIKVGDAVLGALEIKDLDVAYTRDGDVWSGSATLNVPPGSGEFAISVAVRFEHGDLTMGSFNIASFPGIPIYADAYLHSFGGGFDLHPPKSIWGDVEIGAIPLDPPNYALTVDGGFKITFGDNGSPTVIQVTGTGALHGDQFLQAKLLFQTNGYLEADGAINLNLSDYAGIDGGLHAFVDLPAGRFAGEIHGSAQIIGYTVADLDALVSSRGVGACSKLQILPPIKPLWPNGVYVNAGFAYVWGGDLNIMWDGCSLGSLVVVPVTQPAGSAPDGRRRAHAAQAASGTLRIAPHTSVEDIQIRSASGTPAVTLIDPDGRQVTPSATDPRAQVLTPAHPPAGLTVIAIRHPTPGTWRVLQASGSAPITQIRAAQVLPDPVVHAHVNGSGRARTLRYSATIRPNLKTTFIEQAGHVFRTLGIAKAHDGTIRFRPANGPGGRRNIIALIEQNGAPIETIRLASYTAPPPPRPGPIKRLKVSYQHGSFIVTFRPAADSFRSLISISLTDGRRNTILTAAHRLVIPTRGAADRITVTVRGIAQSGTRGPATRATATQSSKPTQTPKQK